MEREVLFNPEILRFDIYSWPVVFAGVLTILLGLFVLVREHGSPVGRRYLAFSASVGLYLVGAGISYAVTTAEASLLWDRIAHVGVLMIPFWFFAATVVVLGETAAHKRTVRILAGITVGYLVLLWTTDWVIAGSFRYFWAWYPRYGVLGVAYLGYFAVVMAFALWMYVRRHRAAADERTRMRLMHFMAAIVVGFGGAIDFLPTVGIELYAAGFIPIAVFSLLTGYAILRFRLVDITPEVASSTILKTLGSAVIVVDNGGIIRVANSRAHELFGLAEPGLVNRPLDEISVSRPEPTGLQDLSAPFRDRELSWSVSGGVPVWLSISATTLLDAASKAIGTVYVGHNITRRKEAEEQLRKAAMYDELTGLPNRKLFFDRLGSLVADTRRLKEVCAILYLDLDGFKLVNDRWGHAAGDDMLRAVAGRLTAALRASDTVARIGGDEFVVLCSHLKERAHVDIVAAKLASALEPPFTMDGGQVTAVVGVSIGYAVYPDDGEEPELLLATADDRMYAAKNERTAR